MNHYERFFRLLWTLIGMVINSTTTIEWLNDCFQTIVDNPSVPRLVFPLRPLLKGKYHNVKTRILEEADWGNLIRFCKDFCPRYELLVEYYQKNANDPVSYRNLRNLGLITGSESSFGVGLNKALRDAGFDYAFKGNHGGNIEDKMMYFVVVTY
jgi:hypothetical protein